MNIQPTNQDLMSYLITMNTRIVGIEGEIIGVKGEITGINGEINGIKSEITGIKGEITSIKGEITGIKNDILRLDSKIDAVYRTLKESIEETHLMFNSFATKIEIRLHKLEVSHA